MPHKEQEFILSKGVITLAALSRKEWKRQKEMQRYQLTGCDIGEASWDDRARRDIRRPEIKRY